MLVGVIWSLSFVRVADRSWARVTCGLRAARRNRSGRRSLWLSDARESAPRERTDVQAGLAVVAVGEVCGTHSLGPGQLRPAAAGEACEQPSGGGVVLGHGRLQRVHARQGVDKVLQ